MATGMIFDELENNLILLADRIVADGARYAAAELRRRCPAERQKTLRAIYARSQGSVAVVGLRFAVRYASTNTDTGRWIKREWDTIRPRVRVRIILALNEGLAEFNQN